ncbi:hypothetical protein BASA62_004517 [Batrachochytrium salamandrivorans]|nr:hypothetical protein BASA62_004517 [Batrachochytrium salamandrivorans]
MHLHASTSIQDSKGGRDVLHVDIDGNRGPVVCAAQMNPISSSSGMMDGRYAGLVGHTGPVSALALSQTQGSSIIVQQPVLASASEDGTVKIWDIDSRSVVRTVDALPLLESTATAAAAAAASDDGSNVAANDGPAAICFAWNSSDLLYVSVGASLLLCDLRSSDSRPWVHVFDAADDINKIDAHWNGSYVALADDSGSVHVLETAATPHKPYRKLRKAHTNIATSVCFRPKRPWQLWSSSMDYSVIHWDYSKGSISESYKYDPLPQTNIESDSLFAQGLNPPFGYDLKFNSTGNTCVVALGDGSIDCIQWNSDDHGSRLSKKASQSLRKANRSTVCRQRLSGPHAWSATAVSFAPKLEQSNDAMDMFVSASIDGSVALWSVPPTSSGTTVSEDAAPPLPPLRSTIKLAQKINTVVALDTSESRVLVAVGSTAKSGARTAVDAFEIELACLDL